MKNDTQPIQSKVFGYVHYEFGFKQKEKYRHVA